MAAGVTPDLAGQLPTAITAAANTLHGKIEAMMTRLGYELFNIETVLHTTTASIMVRGAYRPSGSNPREYGRYFMFRLDQTHKEIPDKYADDLVHALEAHITGSI